MNRPISTMFVALGCALALAHGLVAAQTKEETRIIKDFHDRVNKYESLKSKKGVSSKQTDSATKLAQQKQQAVQKVQEARPEARQGDIFTPQIAAYFKKQIQETLHGPGGEKVRASLRHAEPLPKVQLRVNEQYPKDLPLQSMPPTLLLNLPSLPKGLQYRVVGPTLLLYDEASNIIVDLMPGAVT